MKIAHISDLHLSTKYRPENIRKADKLIAHAVKNGIDHLVITGDISHLGETKDYEILRKILADYDLLHPDKLSMTIGNHDIFGGVHEAEDILVFPKKCRELDYQAKLLEFYEYFPEAFKHSYMPDDDTPFPYAKEVGQVLFVGINSIAPYSNWKNPLASNGLVSDNEITGIKNILYSDRYLYKQKIVLIHHHMMPVIPCDKPKNNLWAMIERRTMKLHNRSKIASLFSKGSVELVLHGHVHQNHSYFINDVQFLNGGASVQGDYEDDLKVNYIYLHSGGINIETVFVPEYEIPIQKEFALEQLIPRFAS
jgi:3',5'-cyclic AMP phosphodiesterase CpdA